MHPRNARSLYVAIGRTHETGIVQIPMQPLLLLDRSRPTSIQAGEAPNASQSISALSGLRKLEADIRAGADAEQAKQGRAELRHR